MPELKSVYFAPDGKWFADRDKCVEYEKKLEIIAYIGVNLNPDAAKAVAKQLVARYTMIERSDYTPPQPPVA